MTEAWKWQAWNRLDYELTKYTPTSQWLKHESEKHEIYLDYELTKYTPTSQWLKHESDKHEID